MGTVAGLGALNGKYRLQMECLGVPVGINA